MLRGFKGYQSDKERIIRNIVKIQKTSKKTECWEWLPRKNKRGHGTVFYKGSQQKAHRASYLIFNGKINQGNSVYRTCGNNLCVCPEHLEQGTQKDIYDLKMLRETINEN